MLDGRTSDGYPIFKGLEVMFFFWVPSLARGRGWALYFSTVISDA